MDCKCCSSSSCLTLPVSWKRLKRGRLRYEVLRKDDSEEYAEEVSVIVGKEKRLFVVEAFVLEEKPFRVLMETKSKSDFKREAERVIFMNNVDAILFEHMLWLFHDDGFSSSCNFCWKDIIDFYSESES